MSLMGPSGGGKSPFPKPISTDHFLAKLQSPIEDIVGKALVATEEPSETTITPTHLLRPAQQSRPNRQRPFQGQNAPKSSLPDRFYYENPEASLDKNGWPVDGSAIVASREPPPVQWQRPARIRDASAAPVTRPDHIQRTSGPYQRWNCGLKKPNVQTDGNSWLAGSSTIVASSSAPAEAAPSQSRAHVDDRYSAARRKGKEAAARIHEIMHGSETSGQQDTQSFKMRRIEERLAKMAIDSNRDY